MLLVCLQLHTDQLHWRHGVLCSPLKLIDDGAVPVNHHPRRSKKNDLTKGLLRQK